MKFSLFRWWGEHNNSCGGNFTKVKEPEGFGQKRGKKTTAVLPPSTNNKLGKAVRGQPDIRSLLSPPTASSKKVPPASKTAPKGTNGQPSGTTVPQPGTKVPPRSGGSGNIFGFGGTSYSSPGGGGMRTAVKAGTIVVKPGGWQPRDNSSPGSVVSGSSTGELIVSYPRYHTRCSLVSCFQVVSAR